MEKIQVVQALKASLISDTKVLKNVECFLQKMQKEKGYCKILMEIFTQTEIDNKIRQAAVIQLKLLVSLRWKSELKDQQPKQKEELTPQQKQFVRDNILEETIKNCRNQTLLKVCQKIIETITDHDAKTWNISDFLINKLNQSSENIVPVLQCAIGVAGGFQGFFSPNKQIGVVFAQAIFPCLQIIFNKFFTGQICYLISKVIYKLCHFDLHDSIRQHILKWIPSFKIILEDFNQAFQSTQDLDNQAKGTQIFYYFHSKKWIARTISSLFLNHMKTKSSNIKLKERIKANKKWMQQTGKQLLQVMYVNLTRRQPLKLKFFMLRCFEGALGNYPEVVQPMAKSLRFQILPQLLKINRSDVIAAKQQPLQFIANEDVTIINWTNVKIQASKVWIDISLIEQPKQSKKSQNQQKKNFNESMQYIKRLLMATPNPQQPLCQEPYLNKELGMFLLIQMSRYMLEIKHIQEKIPQLLQQYIIPQLQNNNMLLKSRAIQVFGAFSQAYIPLSTLRVVAKNVSQSLIDPNSQNLVKIKSAIALFYIVRKKQAKQFLKPHLSTLLKAYVQIINKFDVQLLVNSFQAFLQAFSDCIYRYAQDLLSCLMMACKRMLNRQSQVSHKKKFVDSGMGTIQCLKAMTTTMESTCSSQLFASIEKKLCQFCIYLLQRTGNDFQQELFILLTTFFYKREEINDQFWFFYVAFIYSMSGPCTPKSQIRNLPDSIIEPNERHILHLLTIQKFVDLSEQGFFIIRQFIQFGADKMLIRKDYFGTTYWQLLLKYIINPLQEKNCERQFYNREVVICNSLALAISFVETVKQLPQKPAQQLYSLVKTIYDQQKNKAIRAFNTQLLCLLIYKSNSLIVMQIYKDNRIEQFDKQLCMASAFLQLDIHQTRVIFGICQFLKAPCHRQDKIKSIDSIYRTLIELVGQVIEKRIELVDCVVPQQIFCFKDQQKQKISFFQSNSLTSKKTNDKISELMNKFKGINITEKMQPDKYYQEQFVDLDDDGCEVDIGDFGDLDDSMLGEMWDQEYGETYQSALEQKDQLKHFKNSMIEIETINKVFACHLKGKLQNYEEFAKYLQKAIAKFAQICDYEDEEDDGEEQDDQQFECS